MSIHGFNEWAQRHATMFGFQSDGDLKMLASWEEAFDLAGYGAADLTAATFRMTSAPPRWRAEHLGEIQESIRQMRSTRRQAEERAAADARIAEQSVCSDCRNSGWAIVPHLKGATEGQWIEDTTGRRNTMAVSCHCAIGQKRWNDRTRCAAAAARAKDWVPMTFEVYLTRNPEWRAQMRQEQARKDAERQAHGHAKHRDTVYGEILQRLANVPKESEYE